MHLVHPALAALLGEARAEPPVSPSPRLTHVMTTGVSGRRRRTTVSFVIDREELIALGGFLTQISGALLALTDLLNSSAHHFDRTQLRRAHPDTTLAERRPTAASLLRDCRDGYLAAYTSAQALHADLRRCPADPSTRRKRRGKQ